MISLLFSLALTLPLLSPAPATGWRLRYINLDIHIDPRVGEIRGVSHLEFVLAGRPAPDLVIDLSDSMSVDSARVIDPGPAGNVAGVREPGQVRFPLGAARLGVRYRVAIWYHGRPIRRAVGFGAHGDVPRVASFGIPRSAREWWPSADDPSQKADSADIRLTAPTPLIAASNGRLIDRVVAADGKTATSHWSVRHPIYSDVVSFGLTDYTVAKSSVTLAGGRRVPLEFYVFPEDSSKAAADFAPVPGILAFLEQWLGPYPFADEKYGLVEFARPSFREGQTITNLGAALITGHRDNEQVIAHEVSHQWFGNSLTVRDWKDIWLNESLSEFMAWQWIRESAGDSAYQALFDSAKTTTFDSAIAPANPADFNSLFGNGTFVKGPVVVSMLRDVMGDAAFARALRRYVHDHSYGVVETADFQRAAERAYGKPLHWFFRQWVYAREMPSIQLSWSAPAGGSLSLHLTQTQLGTPFRLPLDLILTRPDGGVSNRRVWVDQADQRISIRDVGDVRDVTIDNHRQLLTIVP